MSPPHAKLSCQTTEAETKDTDMRRATSLQSTVSGSIPRYTHVWLTDEMCRKNAPLGSKYHADIYTGMLKSDKKPPPKKQASLL